MLKLKPPILQRTIGSNSTLEPSRTGSKAVVGVGLFLIRFIFQDIRAEIRRRINVQVPRSDLVLLFEPVVDRAQQL